MRFLPRNKKVSGPAPPTYNGIRANNYNMVAAAAAKVSVSHGRTEAAGRRYSKLSNILIAIMNSCDMHQKCMLMKNAHPLMLHLLQLAVVGPTLLLPAQIANISIHFIGPPSSRGGNQQPGKMTFFLVHT